MIGKQFRITEFIGTVGLSLTVTTESVQVKVFWYIWRW